MNRRLLIAIVPIVVLTVFFPPSLQAQEVISEITNIVPPDVEVSKMSSFGEFDRNLAIGQLNVNVPLHTFDGLSG